MTTYPLATLACTVDENGISRPSYADIVGSLVARLQSIYGSDIYVDPDSQDGQLIAIWAKAIDDSNAVAEAVYNSFRPAQAQGAGLSSIVKINGLSRLTASNSSVEQLVSGDVGTQITLGQVGDGVNAWNLPAVVTIPETGSITVTATAVEQGDIAAPAGTLTKILTPTRGWTSTNNAANATPGAPVETDAALRQRQAASTSAPAMTILDAIVADVGNVAGVTAVMPYENPTDAVDANGLPAHSFSLVVTGGDDAAVAQAIALKKAPGTVTYGTTSVSVSDPKGMPLQINFFRPTVKRIVCAITANALGGYVSTTGDALKAAVAAFVSGLAVGVDVYLNKCIGVADLVGNPLSATYNITGLTLAVPPGAPGAADVVIAFNEQASLVLSDVSLTVT